MPLVWRLRIKQQGYAQIVHHVHYHLVPAPTTHGVSYSAPRSGWASVVGRDELDEEEAVVLADKIRKEVEREVKSAEGGRAKL